MERYDEWFEKNKLAYESELQVIKELLPQTGYGIEIGVGTGRFAQPLGIRIGIEPSKKMGKVAKKRDIVVISGVAEAIPCSASLFDFVIMVTTVCFLDDIKAAFNEIFRILKPAGYFIVGFIDSESPIGKQYQHHKNKNVFYNEAKFFSVKEIIFHLRKARFHAFTFKQTLFSPLTKIKEIEPGREGYGRGSFVVVRAKKFDKL
jgi:SAM-dependent methyltransferase